MTKYNDYPLKECAAAAKQILADRPSAKVFQKFTCAECGSRQTMDTPNIFHKTGRCEECGHVTDIARRGCNYMIHYISSGAGTLELLKSMLRGKESHD